MLDRFVRVALLAGAAIGIGGCGGQSAPATVTVCGNVYTLAKGARKAVNTAYVFVSDTTGAGERHPLDAGGRYVAARLAPGKISILARAAGGSRLTCDVPLGTVAKFDMLVLLRSVDVKKLTCPAPPPAPLTLSACDGF